MSQPSSQSQQPRRPAILVIGGTRGIGLEACRSILCRGSQGEALQEHLRLVLLVRSKTVFLASTEFSSLPASSVGLVELIEGDVRELADVRNTLEMVGDDLHSIVFVVGKSLKLHILILTSLG